MDILSIELSQHRRSFSDADGGGRQEWAWEKKVYTTDAYFCRKGGGYIPEITWKWQERNNDTTILQDKIVAEYWIDEHETPLFGGFRVPPRYSGFRNSVQRRGAPDFTVPDFTKQDGPPQTMCLTNGGDFDGNGCGGGYGGDNGGANIDDPSTGFGDPSNMGNSSRDSFRTNFGHPSNMGFGEHGGFPTNFGGPSNMGNGEGPTFPTSSLWVHAGPLRLHLQPVSSHRLQNHATALLLAFQAASLHRSRRLLARFCFDHSRCVETASGKVSLRQQGEPFSFNALLQSCAILCFYCYSRVAVVFPLLQS